MWRVSILRLWLGRRAHFGHGQIGRNFVTDFLSNVPHARPTLASSGGLGPVEIKQEKEEAAFQPS